MRMIDADRLKAEIMGWYVVTDDLFGMGKYHEREIVLQAIEESPAIDAVPVARGEWIKKSYEEAEALALCSKCSYPISWWRKTNYCPNCGCKMEGKP